MTPKTFTPEEFEKLCLNEREFHKFYLDDDGHIAISGGSVYSVSGTAYTSDLYLYVVYADAGVWEVNRYERNNNLLLTQSAGTGVAPSDISELELLIYT